LSSFKLARHHPNFTTQSKDVEIHSCCDASEKGVGAVAYLMYDSGEGSTVSFLASKTHVAPIKTVSIPRLELQGAGVLAVRLTKILIEEHQMGDWKKTFWTDSLVVLQYLKNSTKRFKPFVANRVAEILDETTAEDWYHIPT
jgi:hypothetical protein